ncbi:hypothetical protein [Lentzea sp. NPDC004782]|uniref:hypothetical protein n=1 Tax=Lentzea sp. NPDC004782 TaxID=3154458 RepID=UPI0033B899A8
MIESATYDIAVSFAEEERAVAGEVAEACRQRGLTVLEGTDLPEAQVRFLVPFVSTVDELLAQNGDEHVLPVLTGEVPSPPHVTYLRADEGLVDALVSRVEAAETAGRDRVSVAAVVAPAPTAAQPETPLLRALAEQFAAASPELTKRGLSGTVHLGDTTVAVRVERSGDTVYALQVEGDGTVNFVVLGGTAELFPTLCQRIEDMLR